MVSRLGAVHIEQSIKVISAVRVSKVRVSEYVSFYSKGEINRYNNGKRFS